MKIKEILQEFMKTIELFIICVSDETFQKAKGGFIYNRREDGWGLWRPVEISEKERERIAKELKALESRNEITVPAVLKAYYTSWWLADVSLEIAEARLPKIIPNDSVAANRVEYEMEFTLYPILPGRELQDFTYGIEGYLEYGSRGFLPIGFDYSGNFLLLEVATGYIYLEDTDWEELFYVMDSFENLLLAHRGMKEKAFEEEIRDGNHKRIAF